MPRRNKNKNFNQRNNNHHNGGVNFNRNNNNNQNRFNRKIYLKPSKLEAFDYDQDYDVSNSQSSSQNNNNNNNNNNYHQNRNYDSQQHNRKNKKENRRRVFENLKEMGIVKSSQPKLSIGDNDGEIKKQLLQAQAHCKLSYIPDDVFTLIVSYVQKYFNCFDNDRQGLLKAYNPKCTFSLCLNTSNHSSNRNIKFDDVLFKENRNLKRIVGNENYHDEKRFKLLRQGYIDTVSFLSKLPPTEHDPDSIKLDSCFFTPNMISFSLNGVYKEGKSTDKVRPLRSFSRVFVCVPDAETQMNIVNEQFLISNATSDQFKTYFQADNQAKKNDSNQAEIPAQQSTTSLNQLNGLNEQQNLMIQQFSAESKLNSEWSKHCLEHAGWNFDEAARAFLQYKDSIPKEAFLN